MKTCTWCKERKDTSKFLVCPTNGHMPQCKACCSGAAVGHPTRWWDFVACSQCEVEKQFSYLDRDGVCMECCNLNRLEAKRLEEEAE